MNNLNGGKRRSRRAGTSIMSRLALPALLTGLVLSHSKSRKSRKSRKLRKGRKSRKSRRS